VLYALEERAQALPLRYVRQAADGFDCLAQVHTDLWGRDWAGHTEHRFWHALTRVPAGAERLTPAQLVGRQVLGAGGRPEPIRAVRQEWKTRWVAELDGGRTEQLQHVCFPGPTPPRFLAELEADGTARPLVAFTGDGRLVVTGGHTLSVLEATTGAVTRTIPLSSGRLYLTASQLELVGPDTALVLLSFEVFRADLRQGTLSPLAKLPYHSSSFAADREWLYFADTSEGISRVPIAGGAPEKLVTREGRARHLVIVGEELVWSVGPKLWRAPKSGGEPRLLATLAEEPREGLRVAFGRLIAPTDLWLLHVPLDSGSPARWRSVVSSVTATGEAGLVASGLMDGTSHAVRLYPGWDAPPRVLLPGFRGELGLAVSADSVAWVELVGGTKAGLVVVTQRLK